jgi:hypothetical protein
MERIAEPAGEWSPPAPARQEGQDTPRTVVHHACKLKFVQIIITEDSKQVPTLRNKRVVRVGTQTEPLGAMNER